MNRTSSLFIWPVVGDHVFWNWVIPKIKWEELIGCRYSITPSFQLRYCCCLLSSSRPRASHPLRPSALVLRLTNTERPHRVSAALRSLEPIQRWIKLSLVVLSGSVTNGSPAFFLYRLYASSSEDEGAHGWLQGSQNIRWYLLPWELSGWSTRLFWS